MASGTIKIIEQLTPTVTKTSGNSVFLNSSAVQSGHFVQVFLTLENTGGATAVGQNAFVGQISGVPLPSSNALGCSYYGSSALFFTIQPSGAVVVRVIGEQLPKVNPGNSYSGAVMYIV